MFKLILVWLQFYKETMANNDEKSEDVEMKEESNDGTNSAAITTESTNEDSAQSSSSSNGKKKKRVQWVPDEKLVSTFYFEMNEDERGKFVAFKFLIQKNNMFFIWK